MVDTCNTTKCWNSENVTLINIVDQKVPWIKSSKGTKMRSKKIALVYMIQIVNDKNTIGDLEILVIHRIIKQK